MNIERALHLWIEITGYEPNKSTYKMNEWDIESASSELKHSLVLDETAITTFMMLDYFVNKYLDDKSFNVNFMLKDFKKITNYLTVCKELYDILHSDEINEIINNFQQSILVSLTKQNIINDNIKDIINNTHQLAFIRRDALKGLKELNLHQFFKGEFNNNSPKYVKTVHEFWSINDLLSGVYHTEDNIISLNLIRDKQGYSSYFCFCIKNGENISILTDFVRAKHPMQKYMMRRPERAFTERVYRNRFPYSILNLEEDDRGRLYLDTDIDSNELKIFKGKAIPIIKIKELNSDEIIWIFMMFDLIKDKFYNQKFSLPDLSYTGEMVTVENSLNDNEKKSLTISNIKLLQLDYLKVDDISTDSMKDEWESPITRQNEWIEKKYEKQIDDKLFNLIGSKSHIKFLSLSDNKIVEKNEKIDKEEINRIRNPFSAAEEEKAKTLVELKKLDLDCIGTKEDVLSDYRWTARYNKAKLINMKVHEDFNKNKKEVLSTYRGLIIKNIDNLFKAIANGEFIVPTQKYTQAFNSSLKIQEENILDISLEGNDNGYSYRWGMPIYNDDRSLHNGYTCYFNKTPSSITIRFIPTCTEALAKICGCEIADLPEPLQHWYMHELYIGNSISQKIDPMEWVVRNPWNDLKLDFHIHLSKTAYNNLRKKYNLPSNKFWLNVE